MTDCEKCIYFCEKKVMRPMSLMDPRSKEIKIVYEKDQHETTKCCDKQMRMTKPICPLFDDGKDVKE